MTFCHCQINESKKPSKETKVGTFFKNVRPVFATQEPPLTEIGSVIYKQVRSTKVCDLVGVVDVNDPTIVISSSISDVGHDRMASRLFKVMLSYSFFNATG